MKTILRSAIFIVLFASCSSVNKILEINDSFKNQNSLKLIQNLDGYSDEDISFFVNRDYIFGLRTVYTHKPQLQSSVKTELKLTTLARTEHLDSVLFLLIDNKKYKLISDNYAMRNYVSSSISTSIETSTSTEIDDEESNSENEGDVTTTTSTTTTTTDRTLQAMKHTFEIPRELWNPIANCNTLMLRTYMNDEGIDVRFSRKELNKFAQLFKEALYCE